MPVAARVVSDSLIVTAIASFEMSAERCRSASADIAQYLALLVRNHINPTSDLNFLLYATYGGKGGGVQGAVKPQGPTGLKKFVRIPVTGMQAKMIQDELNKGMQSAPNYDIFGGGRPSCDCAGFAQWMLGDAGINTGPATDIPSTLMNQLNGLYPQN